LIASIQITCNSGEDLDILNFGVYVMRVEGTELISSGFVETQGKAFIDPFIDVSCVVTPVDSRRKYFSVTLLESPHS